MFTATVLAAVASVDAAAELDEFCTPGSAPAHSEEANEVTRTTPPTTAATTAALLPPMWTDLPELQRDREALKKPGAAQPGLWFAAGLEPASWSYTFQTRRCSRDLDWRAPADQR
jgi:hypothetical protein